MYTDDRHGWSLYSVRVKKRSRRPPCAHGRGNTTQHVGIQIIYFIGGGDKRVLPDCGPTKTSLRRLRFLTRTEYRCNCNHYNRTFSPRRVQAQTQHNTTVDKLLTMGGTASLCPRGNTRISFQREFFRSDGKTTIDI